MVDYLKTIFKLLVGLINPETLCLFALIFAIVLIVWAGVSLALSKELKLANFLKRFKTFFERGEVDLGDNEFVEMQNKMPPQLKRAFNAFLIEGGAPGKFLTQSECVDAFLYGGVKKQNRSLMKTMINGITFIIALLSLAITCGQETILSGLLIGESLVVPLVAFVLFKIIYYTYTAIRQYYYKLAVLRFDEFVDAVTLSFEDGNLINTDEEDLMEEKRGRGRPKKTEEEKAPYTGVKNIKEFERSLERAEKLIAKLNSKELSPSQVRRTNKELAEIMASLQKFKKEN